MVIQWKEMWDNVFIDGIRYNWFYNTNNSPYNNNVFWGDIQVMQPTKTALSNKIYYTSPNWYNEMKVELMETRDKYNEALATINALWKELQKMIELNKMLGKENEILLEQKEAIWQSIQKK